MFIKNIECYRVPNDEHVRSSSRFGQLEQHSSGWCRRWRCCLLLLLFSVVNVSPLLIFIYSTLLCCNIVDIMLPAPVKEEPTTTYEIPNLGSQLVKNASVRFYIDCLLFIINVFLFHSSHARRFQSVCFSLCSSCSSASRRYI